MAESGAMPIGEDSHKISVVESDGAIDSIRVQVIFSGVKKEEMDASKKMLKIPGLKIPMSRFGSWVFRITDCDDDFANMKLGDPTVLFVWALYKSYPEISAWVDDASNCSFILEIEKERKTWILNEIGSRKMQENIQKYLAEISEIDLTIKMIKIINPMPAKAQQAPVAAPQEQTSTSDPPSQTRRKKKSSKSTQGASKEATTEEGFKYLKLKDEFEKTKDKKEKLKKSAELAVLSFEIDNFKEDFIFFFDQMRTFMPAVQASQEDTQAILQNVRKLGQLLHTEGKLAESIDVLLTTSNLVRNIRTSEERVDEINTNVRMICGKVAKIFGVESKTIQVNVDVDDELGVSRNDGRSRSQFAQASKENRNGKRAFKEHNYDEALRCYDAAIRLQPKDMLYHLDKAEVYLAQGSYAECRDECVDALRLQGSENNEAKAYSVLAEAELRLYHPHQAMKLFRKSKGLKMRQETAEKFEALVKDFDKDFDEKIAFQQRQMRQQLLLPPMFGFPPFFGGDFGIDDELDEYED